MLQLGQTESATRPEAAPGAQNVPALDVLDSLTAHIAVLDAQGVIIAVNHAWRAFAQTNAVDPGAVCEGADYLAACTPKVRNGHGNSADYENMAIFAARLRATLAGELEAFTLEYACHSPSEQRWFIARVTRYSGRGPARAVVSHENITERKLVEEMMIAIEENSLQVIARQREIQDQMLRANAELKRAQAYAHIGSWTWEIPANRVEWSDEMYAIFGVDKEGFNGDLAQILQQSIHPEDRAQVEAANLAVSRDKNPAPLEYRVVRSDGSVRRVWGEAGELVLDADGAPRLVRGFVQDITERRSAEENLFLKSAALENAANAMVITDRSGVIQWANPAFEQLSGYTLGEATGRRPKELVYSGKHDAGFYRALWETIASGGVWRGEIINRRKDGSLYTEEMTITPLCAGGQEITHFVAVKQDVSERNRREREREAMATLAADLRSARTRAEMLDIILTQLASLLGADGAFFAWRQPGEGDTLIERAAGRAGAPFAGLRLPPGQGIVGQVIESGRAFASADVRLYGDELFNGALAGGALAGGALSGGAGLGAEAPCAVACAPLNVSEKPLGALCALRREPILNGELHLLTAIAEMTGAAIHRAALHEQTRLRLERITVLTTIDHAIRSSLDLAVTLNILIDQIIHNLHADAADILLFNPASETLEYAAGSGFRADDPQRLSAHPGRNYAQQAADAGSPLHVSREQADPETLAHWRREGFVEYYCIPLLEKGARRGALEIYHRRPQPDQHEWIDFLNTLGGQALIAIENARLFEDSRRANRELAAAYEKTIEGWSKAMDLRDRETEGHTQRVTAMSLRLAAALGVSDDALTNIRRGALLHDIGKLGVPDAILHKPGPLDAAEWAQMRRHPVYAVEMLAPIEYLRPALDIPHYHHERWDGRGYPCGLSGEQIPLAARLFALADVYDALTSDRPYRPAWSPEQAVEYIRSQAGSQFDPQIVDLFMRLWDEEKSMLTDAETE